MTKIRVRHKGQRSIYIHNDLGGATHYFKARIDERIRQGDTDGIYFEYMTLATMLAFEFEARVNFLGQKLIKKWNERDSLRKKMKIVTKRLGITVDWKKSPFVSIDELKKLRDTLAHGKPIEEDFDVIIEGRPEEIDRIIQLNGPWEKHCSYDSVVKFYSDAEQLWKDMFERSGLTFYEAQTRGSSGLTVIDKIEDRGT